MKEKLRQVLTSRDRIVYNDGCYKESAVLIPVYEKSGHYHIVFTLRTEHLRYHKGEISFPGGGRHEGDKDLLITALRESREEIGLKEEDVEVMGALDDAVTVVSHYRITPFVGLIPYPYEFKPDPFEVQEIFALSIEDLLYTAKIKVEDQVIDGQRLVMYTYEIGGRTIWGATARILNRFFEVIRPLKGTESNH